MLSNNKQEVSWQEKLAREQENVAKEQEKVVEEQEKNRWLQLKVDDLNKVISQQNQKIKDLNYDLTITSNQTQEAISNYYIEKSERQKMEETNKELNGEIKKQTNRKEHLNTKYENVNDKLKETELKSNNKDVIIETLKQKHTIFAEYGSDLTTNVLLETVADKRHENSVDAYASERCRLNLLHFATLAICCTGMTLFWIHASRLYTEPNIILMSPQFDEDCKIERSEYSDVVGVTAGIMILDFLRTFLMVMVIPTSIIWYSYYIEDSESKNLDLKVMQNFKRFFLKQLVWTLLVSFFTVVTFVCFVVAEQYLSMVCPTTASVAVGVSSFFMCLASMINPVLYFLQVYFGGRIYQKKSVSDGTFSIGWKILKDGMCCGSKVKNY